MRKKENFFLIFIFFVLLSLILSLFYRNDVIKGTFGIFEYITVPIQRLFFGSQVALSSSESEAMQQLQAENNALLKKLVDQNNLQRENDALTAQFQTTSISPQDIVPAQVIGLRGFIPGLSQPDMMIVDKGKSDGITAGTVVVYKDNLIGKVVYISSHASRVELLNHSNTSFTGKTLETNALGIIKGKEQEGILFDNIVLSDTLKVGNTVITKGDEDQDAHGFPPNLIVGKVISVDKKPSALFQTAEVQSLVDVTKIDTVFLLKPR